MNKPNIIMIISDDHGSWAMGCADNKEVISPNIDSLAKDGLNFQNFFCTSPVCSPARASIFTGKIPSQHGVLDWIAKGHINEEELSEDLKQKFYSSERSWQYDWPMKQLKGDKAINYLEGNTLFTEVLNDVGYECALIGKWHLGNSKDPKGGFSYYNTLAMGGDNYFYPVVLENNEFVMKDNVYVTDYITKKSLEYLENIRNREKPFYLSVHYTAPHSPWDKGQHQDEYLDLYKDCDFSSVPLEKPHEWGTLTHLTDEQFKQYHKTSLTGYYSAITSMDKGIGDIITYLKRENLYDNTLIIFTGDNGMSMGHHGIYGKGNSTFPLNLYDTAVKVPMVIKPAYYTNFGKNINDLLSHYDIAPTILDYIGLPVTMMGENIVGHSFKNILLGEKLDKDNFIFVTDEYGPNRMIRTKDWKYIHRYPYGPNELYHISEDIDEKFNLINKSEFKDIIHQLKFELQNWFDKYSDIKKDGRTQAVKGNGQIDLVGFKNNSFL